MEQNKKLTNITKHLFSNYLSSVYEVRAEANSDSSHSHSLCKSNKENEDIDEVVIWEDGVIGAQTTPGCQIFARTRLSVDCRTASTRLIDIRRFVDG
uniref:Uncharacterized protein n=1 Tax=Romanomermis culicivorax TaxID=13658 RepID=A0A915J075_ROMCU